MLSKLSLPGLILIASIFSLILAYFKVAITTYQQIIVLLMVLLLALYNALTKSTGKGKLIPSSVLISIILTLGTLFVQLLIISTGGLLSPFLILIHLVTLAVSFLINLKISLSFFFSTLAVLLINIFLNFSQLEQIKNDPGTILLYLVSFLIILPLSHLISTKYHLKDQLSKILSQKIEVEESIIESLNELVVVTDKNLKITSVNDALEKMLGEPKSSIINKSFFSALGLKDPNGLPATIESLSIDRILEEKTTRIAEGFLLYTKKREAPYSISIQMRPILDLQKEIREISFVITEGNVSGKKDEQGSLERAKSKKEFIIQNLRKEIQKTGISKLNLELEFLNKIEKDIELAHKIKEHPIKLRNKLIDIAETSQQVINSKKNFASILGVKLNLSFPEGEIKEKSLLDLKNSGNVGFNLPPSNFSTMTDPEWTKVLLESLIDIALLISSGSKNSNLYVSPIREGNSLRIEIATDFMTLPGEEDDLYKEDYSEDLNNKTNLKFGSGLEGYIAKVVSTQLGIILKLVPLSHSPKLTFQIQFSSLPS